MQDGWSLSNICNSAKYKQLYCESFVCTGANIWYVETVKDLIKENHTILISTDIKMVLRCTNRQVAGSIPNGVIEIFQ
jgi:hypothetical protein